jgi:hypothetical protein
MDQGKYTRDRLASAIRRLRDRVRLHRSLEKQYRSALAELQAKEAFNFALFQYSPLTTVVVDREGRVVKSNMAKRLSGDRMPHIGDLMYKDYAGRHRIDMRAELLGCIAAGTIKTFPEMRYGDKILSITIAPFPEGAIITTQDITTAKLAEEDRIRLIDELRAALAEVENLRGLLPICASCKKIRDDGGYWNRIEDYFSRRSMVNFSHTMCPECMQKLYPEFWEKMANNPANRLPVES